MRKDIIKERQKKVKRLREEGIDPYPVQSQRTHTVQEVLDSFSALKKTNKTVTITGRLYSVRDQGNIIFTDIQDASGRIQGILKKDSLKKQYTLLKKTLEAGDFIQLQGKVLVTKKKAKSVAATKVTILTKALRPLPTEFYGIQKIETRLRKRYLDTLLRPETKEMFEKKSVFWNAIRTFLNKENFIEVITPVLEETPGGAEAEPFVTHYNALDKDFYLRISLEISLKKILVGGFEKVYEIGHVFRNEGVDAQHLQDYTQMEFYWAYADYRDLMKFLQRLYKFVIKETMGTLKTSWQGKTIDWGKKWKVVDYCTSFKKAAGLDPTKASKQELFNKARELGLFPQRNLEKGRLIDLIYKKTVRTTLIQPTFLINPPTIIEPLAKRDPENPDVVERLQIIACGTELGKGFSEANDPQDQRKRFEEQATLRKAGDKEAQMLDEDFLEALEYGMPPAAGFGLSERLFSILVDKPIRETVFFPPMKKKK